MCTDHSLVISPSRFFYLQLVQQTSYKAINLTDTLLEHQSSLEEDYNVTKGNLHTIAEVCIADSPMAQQINTVFDQLSSQIYQLGDMIRGTLESFSGDLNELILLTEDIDKQSEKANIIFVVLMVISVILVSITLAMLVGVFFSIKGISNCFTRFFANAIMLPLFTFFLVLSWIITTLFLAVSLSGSDFCVAPDDVIIALLVDYKHLFSSALFGFIIYYVSGCSVVPPAEEKIAAFSKELYLVADSAHQLSEVILNQTVQEVQQECGLDEAGAAALQNGATLLHDATHAINYSIVNVRNILQCSTFNPIYQKFVYDAICIEALKGLICELSN